MNIDNLQDDENIDEFSWRDSPGPANFGPSLRHNFRNDRYSNAYGNYSGGYGRGGGFGPTFNYGPPSSNFGPPPSPSGPRFMFGRGFGPFGPPVPPFANSYGDQATRFLLRCGVPKENVKNLPKDLLKLIEPEYCGLCAQSFDNFALARIHYSSRNHFKNQKKWLSLHSDYGYGMEREPPLRSRDIYCELCDVEITSKSHAESHYAGKPHRAIVEGKKNAKNPMLLQKNKEKRLMLLIRREKKYLKSIEEIEKEDTNKEAKNAPPELCCDICKTSVTCSEQMTMHLNGKKHLAKEKQHILRMMQGGIKAESNDNETTAVGDEEQAENSGEKEDNFEWGNGSEKWEDL